MPGKKLTPKKKGKKRRKKSNNYFTKETQEAIVDFKNEPDAEARKQIFVDRIEPAFAKLIENLLFVYRFHTLGNIDTLKNDCMSYLFENITKFKPEKNSKAFSYFNVVARNWFILKWKNNKKKDKTDVQFDKNVLAKLEQNENEAVVMSYEDEAIKQEYLDTLKDEVKRWRGKFEKDQERKVLEAVILLLDNPELLPIYNKKGIYLYIREITGLNTKQVVTNLTKLKKKYGIFKRRYFNGEI